MKPKQIMAVYHMQKTFKAMEERINRAEANGKDMSIERIKLAAMRDDLKQAAGKARRHSWTNEMVTKILDRLEKKETFVEVKHD